METMPFPLINLIISVFVLTMFIGIPLLIGYAVFMMSRNTKSNKQLLEEILDQQKETNQMLKHMVSGKSQLD